MAEDLTIKEPLHQQPGASETHIVSASLLASLRSEQPGAAGYSDGSRPKPEHVPTLFDDAIWSLGWTDGRLVGSDSDVLEPEEFFKNQARLWVNQRKVEIEADYAAHQVAGAELETEQARQAGALQTLREMQTEVASHSLRHNTTYSKLMAFLLFALGALLLFADIPLTAQLATKSLGFADAVCVNIKDGRTQPYDPERPCEDPWQVQRLEGSSLGLGTLKNFLDVFVLALALAACSFIVKLLMDAVYQGQLRRGSKYLPRTLMLLVVFGLFVALMIVLGTVRFGIFDAETAVLEKALNRYELRLTEAKQAANAQQGNADDVKTIEDLIDTTTARITGRRSGPVRVGFILLTILFPLVSGVLFHFAVQSLHYWHAAKKAPDDLVSAEQRLDGISAEALKEKKVIAGLDALLRAISEESVVSALAEQWTRLYCHGRRRGAEAQSTFDSAESLYDRALYRLERRLGY